MRAVHRATGEAFALKVLEKAKIRRMAARHKNIHNEVMMEKVVMARLRHPNVVRLYHTFSDDISLYYLYELLNGGELWNKVMDATDASPSGQGAVQIGCDLGQARHYLLQVVDALEYIHSQGVLHR